MDERKNFRNLGAVKCYKAKKSENDRVVKGMYSNLKKMEEFSHMTLLKELKENNPDDFKDY